MNFVRSLPGPQESCAFGYAEQQNQITHFHDGSQVYGSDEEEALKLRTGKEGLMKSYKPREGKELLRNRTYANNLPEGGGVCFSSFGVRDSM